MIAMDDLISILYRAKRHAKADYSVCTFDYVQLKSSEVSHHPLLALVDDTAKLYGMKPIYARLSRYNVSDRCVPHMDTIPHVRKAVSVRFDDGDSRLVVGGVLLEEGKGKVNVFDPYTEHEVLPIESGHRIVLNFWLTDLE